MPAAGGLDARSKSQVGVLILLGRRSPVYGDLRSWRSYYDLPAARTADKLIIDAVHAWCRRLLGWLRHRPEGKGPEPDA